MMIRLPWLPLAVFSLCSLILAACSSTPAPVQSASPGARLGGIYKVGKPYQVDGTWYYPSVDASYDETGIASWYGPNFHERYTANGEIFDQNQISAAHKTLPLPSIVEVDNLDNGRSIEVRVNDRGPYVGNRIIDMSKHAAELLGFDRQGTAKVRVRYLVGPSLQVQALAQSNGGEQIASETPIAAPSAPITSEALPLTGVASAELPPPVAPTYRGLPQPVPSFHLPDKVHYVPVHPTGIYIQAGAFSLGDNAFRMKARLDAFAPASVTGTVANGLNLYRVRVGPIATVDQADDLLSRMHAAGIDSAKIVVD